MHGFTVIDDSIRNQIIRHPVPKQVVLNHAGQPPCIKDGTDCGALCQRHLHKVAYYTLKNIVVNSFFQLTECLEIQSFLNFDTFSGMESSRAQCTLNMSKLSTRESAQNFLQIQYQHLTFGT